MPRRCHAHAAISLVELLVSMSVLGALVLMLSNLFNQVNRAWMTGEGGTERRRNSRAITDYLAEELRGAQVPISGGGAVTSGNLQFVVNPPGLTDDYRNADAVFWQAPIATETSFGDLAAVGYFVKWESSGAGRRPILCRYFVNPSENLGTGVQRNPNFLVYDPDPKAWLQPALMESVVQPANRAQGYKGLFAENVLGLWINCLDRSGKAIPVSGGTKFDSREGYMSAVFRDGTTWQERKYLPVSVRVSLAQIDSRHASRLEVPGVEAAIRNLSKASTDADDFLQRLRASAQTSAALQALLPSVRVYATEVQLRNAL